MKRIVRRILLVLAGILALAVIVLASVYVYFEVQLGITYAPPVATLEVPGDEASIAEGERLARTRGCMGGCHGKQTEGSIFFELPDGTRVVAPDLGRIADAYSIEELEHAMRHGVRPDGTSVIDIMPSSMLTGLTDSDIAAIIAFLQSRSPGSDELPSRRLGPIVRAMLMYFSWTQDWTILAAGGIDHDVSPPDSVPEEPLELGRYVAMTMCTECHGNDLRGRPDEGFPSLAIVAAYSLGDFSTLMRTGVPIGDRELDLMKEIALTRGAYLTDSEVESLHIFLQTLADVD